MSAPSARGNRGHIRDASHRMHLDVTALTKRDGTQKVNTINKDTVTENHSVGGSIPPLGTK
jgi:hypothetical protein